MIINVSTALHNWRANQVKAAAPSPHAGATQARLRTVLAKHRAQQTERREVKISPSVMILVTRPQQRWGKGSVNFRSIKRSLAA